MAGIPLHCNICPNEPNFSDTSHLLTHINSKAHLSHHKNTKLKAALNDPIAEAKKVAYKQWYERYHIERLLSERLAAKSSKDASIRITTNKAIPRSSKPTEKKARKKRVVATSSQRAKTPSPAKAEEVIDPQLSQSHLAHRQESSLVSFGDDTGASHRSYVPHMGGWHNASPPTHQSAAQTSSPTSNPQQLTYGYGRDALNDDDFLDTILRSQRSPTRTEYPDPADYGGLPVVFPSIEQEHPEATVDFLRDPSPGTENTGPIQSPVLKGVIYKGMGIFDSASPEAQRRRNQKKDGSRIQRMQNDSAAVEQIENIYFADGTLKKARLITGNVESSPPRELSPPPVPKKRQRTKVNKAALREISTNGSNVVRKPRQRKTAFGNLQQISEKALVALDHDDSVCPKSTLIDSHSMDEEPERHLTFGATDNVRRRDFKIFRDQIDYHEDLHKSCRIASFSQTETGNPSLHSHGSGSTRRRVPLGTCQPSSQRRFPAQLEHPAGDSFPRTFGEKFSASMAYNKENRQPVGSEARTDDSAGTAFEQRITQRYFSVTGNQAPQYYSTLPPQMDFGGLSEPKYYGTTLNPLNTQLRSHEVPSYTNQSNFHWPTSASRPDDRT